MAGMEIRPFAVDVPQATLDDLRARLGRTRWPDEVEGAGWDYGASLAYLQALVEYWGTRFDWRAEERAMNALPHFRADVDGHGIHFIHVRGARGRGPAPLPLLITHGWPSSFVEMLPLIPLLADPGGPRRRSRGRLRRGGALGARLRVLGPAHEARHDPEPRGRPLGAADGWPRLRALRRPRQRHRRRDHRLDGRRLPGPPDRHPHDDAGLPVPGHRPDVQPPSDAERAHAEIQARWEREEGGYNLIQETRPQTLAYGLHDSPAGLAAWILEKWRAWTDPAGDVERYFSRDLLLANVTLYWVTGTINAANRSYYERAREPRRITSRITVPTGVALSTEAVQRVPARAGRAELRRHPAVDRVPARRPLLRGGGAAPPGGGAPRLPPPVPSGTS